MKQQAIIVCVLALLTALPAWWPRSETAQQQLQRTRLVPEAVAAEDLARLRIVAWDARQLQTRIMEIEKQGQDWVLPQHYQYPADAGARVGELAGTLLHLELGRSLGNDVSLWNEFHLHDPLNSETDGTHHHGHRVSLWTADSQAVLDIIVGARIPGSDSRRYMRFVDDNRCFAIDFDQALPTRFSDWVDTTLLPINPNEIRYLQVHQYSFDEERRRVRQGVVAQFLRSSSQGLWRSPNADDGQTVDDTAVYKVLKAALDARLYGVRPFSRDGAALAQYGFFYNRGIGVGAGRDPIAGNEGSVTIGTSSGLFYHIYLGEVAQLADVSGQQGVNYRYVMLLCDYRVDQDDGVDQGNVKERMAGGKQRAAALNRRFAKYIYIIDNERFQQLHPRIEDMFKATEEQP